MGRSQTVEGPDPPDPGRRDLPDAEPAPLMSERRVSLIGGMLAAIGPVSMALYTPAMTEIVDAFGTTESLVKLTLTLYFGGFAFRPAAGRAAVGRTEACPRVNIGHLSGI